MKKEETCLHCKQPLFFGERTIVTHIDRPFGAKRKHWIRGYLCVSCEEYFMDYESGEK